jgi:undecaprenyl-diphosphatase
LLLSVILAALAAMLTAAIIASPESGQDLAVMNWITDWDLPGLTAFFTVVSLLTSLEAGMVYGVVGLAGLLIARMQRLALAFVLVGVVVGVFAFLGDYVLSDLVERSRPSTGSEVSSYPSGHVFGGTVLFGFLTFLALEHRSKPKISIVVIVVSLLLVVAVGPSRVYEGEHWPSDVAAGYLFAGITLTILFPLYRRYTDRGFGLGFFHARHFPAAKAAIIERPRPRKTAR